MDRWRMTRWLFVGKPSIKKKKLYKKTGSKSCPGKNDIVQTTLTFSNSVLKAGMKTIGEGAPAAREPIAIANRTRNTSKITQDNSLKTTRANQRILEMLLSKNKERIRQRLRDQKQRKRR